MMPERKMPPILSPDTVGNGRRRQRPGTAGARGRNDGKSASLSLGGWAVGAQAKQLPDGLAFFVPKGADLILSTHFHPSGKPEKEMSTLGLYF